MGWANSPHK
ncbi:hypothetical protein AYI68_g3478, partial [Smittium mucronatum]